MRLCLFGSGNHLLLRRIGTAIQDVVAHRTVQQGTVLLHNADLVTQAVLSDPCDVLPVDQNLTALRIIKPQK